MGNAVEEFFVSIPDTVRGLFRHDPSTRAASVEFWVVASTCLLLLKYAVGSIGPRMLSSRHVNPGVQLVRIFSYYSVAYSLGLMQPSTSVEGSASNDLFMVWAVLIVTMQDSVSIGRPYKPQEMSTVDLLTSLWSANQLRANTPTYLKVPLWLIWSIHASRIIWYYVSSDGASGASADNMKLVGDYMATRQYFVSPPAPDPSPATMVGYRYLVLGEDEQEMQVSTVTFKSELVRKRPEELITVESVWSHRDDKLLGTRDSDDKFKDVCLSFALYKLLRRRFFDFPIPEAKDKAMRRLVSEAILDERNNYERAFRVTEVELSFLQDFSYSKHAVVFASGFPTQRLMLSLLMISAASCLAYSVRELPPAITALTSGDRLATITHGVLVTRAIILIMVCRELWEIGVFVLSQWTKLVIICHYIRLQQRPAGWFPKLQRLMTEKVARIMFRAIRRGQWNQNIQQYNLLMMGIPLQTTKNGRLRSRSVKLQSEVKKTIFDSLKKVLKAAAPEKGSPSASAQRRSSETLISHYKSAFADTNGPLRSSIEDMHIKLKGDTHKILVWHVATSLCQIKLLKEARSRGNLYALETPAFTNDSDGVFAAVWPDYITAASLSNYCAYLVTEALVPDNGLVAKTVFDRVREEAGENLAGCGTLANIHEALIEAAGKRDEQKEDLSIVEMGTKLSEKLTESYADRGDLWKRLGRFWAGFLLHLSASTTAAKHRIHLQGNGELTTHLWALLSHAGFLGETAHGQQLLDPVDLNAA